jgi:hypothetical protein
MDYSLRDSALSEINNDFDVIYPNPKCTNVAQAKIFCITDWHGDLNFKKKWSRVVNALADEKSLVLVEAVPSMRSINKTESTQSLYLKDGIKIMGWDAGAVQDLLPIPELIETAKCDLIVQKTIAAMRQGKSDFSLEELDSYTKAADYLQKIGPRIMADIDLGKRMVEMVAEKMPQRVDSMITTLDKVSQLPEVSTSFVIGGEDHFKEASWQNDPRMKLDKLRAYLADKEAVIFLRKGGGG